MGGHGRPGRVRPWALKPAASGRRGHTGGARDVRPGPVRPAPTKSNGSGPACTPRGYPSSGRDRWTLTLRLFTGLAQVEASLWSLRRSSVTGTSSTSPHEARGVDLLRSGPWLRRDRTLVAPGALGRLPKVAEPTTPEVAYGIGETRRKKSRSLTTCVCVRAHVCVWEVSDNTSNSTISFVARVGAQGPPNTSRRGER